MQPVDSSRRRLLGGLASVSLAASLGTATAQAQARVRTNAHIVIVGSGLGGIAAANRLSRQLDGARITIVDKREAHFYQPGWTLVASGIWPADKTVDSNARYHPEGVEWVKENVAEFDPVANALVTESGQRISYDFLIVATGCQLNYGAIEGMDTSAIGQNGLGSVYHSVDAAAATWTAMDAFRKTGGRAVALMPHTPMKCAGAPVKMAFMLADRLREAGKLEQSSIRFYSGVGTVFGVPAYNELILDRFDTLGIGVEFNQRLASIDIGSRRATFVGAEGEKTEADYDFIHVVPPMSAPDAVRNSPLAWQDGNFAAGGWLEVDEKTLRHRRFPNVFGLGDVNGTRRGKTAATVKAGVPIVVTHLIEAINGQENSQQFNGYTSCPLIVREGSALLVEFDYEGNLVPSLPFVDPMQESYFAWVLKHRMLLPAYRAVLRGRA
ncbi:MAG TPA: pyridine nucleotide-disulfide oxidoreductase [Xanthomonadaceae bacterium]|jgi:sulfide:quinone oxidoreductase|nr:pyridine nucleotide-disulfide oxidoreductase [Xanthomonadaceae bacterium]